MTFDADRLYHLLPTVHRVRDAERGEPLRALMAVIAEQVLALEENLAQLYDDQFVETCAEWAVPYIGDVIGYRPLHGVVPAVASPRAEVANTIAYRRRKGTASMLEQLARDVTGWNARVVEYFLRLSTTQYMNHIRAEHHGAPDLRNWALVERSDTPFDEIAHTADVRHIDIGEGKYNIPNIGIHLWRLGAYSATDVPAVPDASGAGRYRLAALGHDLPLVNRPDAETEITHLAEPANVPEAIARRVLHEGLARYYGAGRSILVTIGGVAVPSSAVRVCHLETWRDAPIDRVLIDPELGRIVVGADLRTGVVATTSHRGFPADLGGGEYDRSASIEDDLDVVATVTTPQAIGASLPAASGGGAIEIGDNGRYESEILAFTVDTASHLELRAAARRRPTVLLDADASVTLGEGATLSLDGLLVASGAIVVPDDGSTEACTLRIRHSTLVPGGALDTDGAPTTPGFVSIRVERPGVTLVIEDCIVGALRVHAESQVEIVNSIVDATLDDDERPTRVAYAAPDGDGVGGRLTLRNCTVIGKLRARIFDLVTNSILYARLAAGDAWAEPIRAERVQEGCIRYSYVPRGCIVPRRYQCHPADAAEAATVRPIFTSLRSCDAGYGQLAARTPLVIRTGADDESEMGVYHDLYQPQRESNLRTRLEEYLRVGLEAGIFYAT